MSYIGAKLYSLTVIKRVDNASNGHPRYLFQCDCGEYREAKLANVKRGEPKACKSCTSKSFKQKKSKDYQDTCGYRTHEEAGTELWRRWQGMKNRCRCNTSYLKKGIIYDTSWESYLNFKEDMGMTHFSGAELDRIDNTKGYSKGNCQWLTIEEHAIKSANERADTIAKVKL